MFNTIMCMLYRFYVPILFIFDQIRRSQVVNIKKNKSITRVSIFYIIYTQHSGTLIKLYRHFRITMLKSLPITVRWPRPSVVYPALFLGTDIKNY